MDKRKIMNIMLTLAGGYLVLVFLLFIFQRQILFLPDASLIADPGTLGLNWEEAVFEAEDGIRLHGWYIPNPDADHLLLFSHGNAGNISHRLNLLEMFYAEGFATFIYDYRGYGESEGRPSERGLYLDIEAAWNHAIEELGYREEQMILYGRSLGGPVAARQAMKVNPAALVLESTFTNARDVARDAYPFVPSVLVRFEFDTLAYLQQVETPLLILHSPDDSIVRFHHGQTLYENANSPREFVEISGGHNDNYVVTGSRYFEVIMDFVARQTQLRNISSEPSIDSAGELNH